MKKFHNLKCDNNKSNNIVHQAPISKQRLVQLLILNKTKTSTAMILDKTKPSTAI